MTSVPADIAGQSKHAADWLDGRKDRMMEYHSRNIGQPCTGCENTVQNRVAEKVAEISARNVFHLESGVHIRQLWPKFRPAKCKTENVHTKQWQCVAHPIRA